MATPLNLVTAQMPVADGCPILTMSNVYILSQGVTAIVQHVLRDRIGNPVNLEADGISESLSISTSFGQPDEAVSGTGVEALFMAIGNATPHIETKGVIVDAPNGVVQIRIPPAITNRPTLYNGTLYIVQNGERVFANNLMLSVEPTVLNGWGCQALTGVPTIQEIRIHMADNPQQNNLLRDYEFNDAQIVDAILRPIQIFNEIPPILYWQASPTTFPGRIHWIEAVVGLLHEYAAANYRRNRLAVSAGGMVVDDKNREPQYMAVAEKARAGFMRWATMWKVQYNASQGFGRIG